MEPIKVFISSVLNRSKEDLSAEREAAKNAVMSMAPQTSVWAFEDEPASSKALRDSYIDEVKTCNVLVLLLGRVLTEPTKEEFDTARDYDKPILVFVKDLPEREQEARGLLADLDKKYARFGSPVDLEKAVRHALGQQILTWAKRGAGGGGHVGDKLSMLRTAMRKYLPVRLSPLVPSNAYDRFTVRSVEPSSVVFEKQSSSQSVTVPAGRITEILSHEDSEPASVILNGRLQWHTVSEQWRFLLESPDQTDGLMLGLGKQSGLRDPALAALGDRLARRARQLSWSLRSKLPARLSMGYEVFYDEDGRYLYSLGHDGQILVVKPDQAASGGTSRSAGKVHLVRRN